MQTSDFVQTLMFFGTVKSKCKFFIPTSILGMSTLQLIPRQEEGLHVAVIQTGTCIPEFASVLVTSALLSQSFEWSVLDRHNKGTVIKQLVCIRLEDCYVPVCVVDISCCNFFF